MGNTNLVQIMHGDINYILQEEIALFTMPCIDDVAIKGPVTHYENADGTYETIPENSGIHRFIWEHLANVNQILQQCNITYNPDPRDTTYKPVSSLQPNRNYNLLINPTSFVTEFELKVITVINRYSNIVIIDVYSQ
jgi:hypothetical protein